MTSLESLVSTSPTLPQTQPIFDWIAESPANLILHPPSIPVSNVMMAVLCMKAFEGKTILLMSTDPQAVSNCIGVALPENMFLPYTTNCEMLQSACQCACYIFIDNLTLFRQSHLGDLLSQKTFETKCVMFGTSRPGISDLDLDYVKTTFPDIKIANFVLSDPGPTIVYEICPSLLQLDKPDKQDNQSSELNQIRFQNPKIFQLLLQISLNHNCKHLVFTENSNDLELIETLLTQLKINSSKIERFSPFETQRNTLKIFNQSDVEQQCILLTNTTPIDDVHNVSYLHFLNGINLIQLSAILNRIHRRRLFSLPIQKLTLVFHIAQNEDGSDGDDAKLYRLLTVQILSYQKTFDTIQSKSQMIICSGSVGLCVI